MNLVENPAITPVQIQRPSTTVQPPQYSQYPQYPKPPPQVYQNPSVQYASQPQVTYQQPYAQRGGYRGRGRGHYSPMGSAQGQYQQQGQYGGPHQQYGVRSLQLYQAPRHQYVKNSNYQGQGFQVPSTNVKRYNNWNYCHTHGFDVKDEHDSLNCLNPSWNHNWQETRENM